MVFGQGTPTKKVPSLDEEPVKISHKDLAAAEVIWDFKEADATPVASAAGLLLYIGVWICSVASPLILLALFAVGWHVSFSIVLGLAAASYLPRDALPRVDALRSHLRDSLPRYFNNCSLRMEAVPAEEEPTVLCVHPHGIFCLGWGQLFLEPVLSHVHFCFSSVLVLSPFFRLFTRLIGKPEAVDKDTVLRLMKERKSLALIPGGFEDATLHSPSADRAFLSKRKGFVKYALQNGYSLTPVFSFGEKDTFDNAQGNYEARFKLNAMGIPAIAPSGLAAFPLLPRRVDVHIVVGEPLKLPACEDVTRELVDEWHGKYVEHLKAFYDRHAKWAYEGREIKALEVW